MEFNVKTISSQMIKPSTPTPHHLKSYKLCLLDQFFGFGYVPQVFFYNSTPLNQKNFTNEITNIPSQLRESLSKTITLFYPLAGRLTVDKSVVDCNDKGVSFVEARVHCTLRAFLESPNRVDSLPKFLPAMKRAVDNDGRKLTTPDFLLVAIQVTLFDCGGIAIGCHWDHKIMDGASWGIFLKNWAAFMVGRSEEVVIPDFETASSLFPPISSECMSSLGLGHMAIDDEQQETDECLTSSSASFVFIPEAITSLQDKAKTESVPIPTRIEAISGFIWKHAAAAASATASTTKLHMLGPSVASFSVNMRPHTKPPLSPTVIGNLITHSLSYFHGYDRAGKSTPQLPDLVAELRNGFSLAKDAKFLSKYEGGGGAEFARQFKQNLTINLSNDTSIGKTCYRFTSWSRFDMCVDFGFGMPIWIGFTSGPERGYFGNLTPLIEIPGYGIEAWMMLDEQEMAILQSDQDFLAFASPSTSSFSAPI